MKDKIEEIKNFIKSEENSTEEEKTKGAIKNQRQKHRERKFLHHKRVF